MKAVSYTKYGSPEVLQIVEADAPVPKENEVLINVHATTVNRTDCGFRSARYFVSRFVTGLVRPKQQIMGSEFAGEIVAVGASVKSIAVGDRVFGFDDMRGAAHAEFMTISEDGPFDKIPSDFDYEQVAAAGEGATYALNDIEAAGVSKGQKVLVYGASGAIGSAAVQILKYISADVTAVCGGHALVAVKSLGADKVINYQKEDFTQTDDRYDFVFDAVGKTSYGKCKKLLNEGGKYCSTELGKGCQNPLLAIWFALTGSRKVIFPIPKINKAKITYIKELLEAGAYRPLIDRTYSLDQIVEATEYVESGQKVGNVVILI